MFKYAVLGGTGSTGSAIIAQLLAQGSPGTLHVYARNEKRLLHKIPTLEAHIAATYRTDQDGQVVRDKGRLDKVSSPQVKLFIGDMSDIELLAACLAEVDVVFQTLAANVSEPDISIAQDAARVCVEAIALNRKRSPNPAEYVAPTILFLSSASCSPRFALSQGKWAHDFLHDLARWYIYHDLELGQAYLEQPEHDWIPHVIVCPNGLTEGEAVGHTIGLEPSDVPFGTYADLGGAMIEIAQDQNNKWTGKMVQAASKSTPKDPQVLVLVRYVFIGLLCRLVRPAWSLGRLAGWW